MTQNNRIWVLMSRRLSGEATPAEAEELYRLLEQAPDKQYLFGILHSYFSDGTSAVVPGQTGDDPGLEERFRRIMDLPNENEFTKKSLIYRLHGRKSLGYAAAVAAAVLFFLGWGISRFVAAPRPPIATSRSPHTEEVQARAGARTHLLLPDGTQVWLNSNSRLSYSKEFNSKDREVGLEGEACFYVARNVEHPFIVHASSLDVKALGTTFTVKSYPQDKTVEATLLDGSIEISRKNSPNSARIILKPNEKFVFNKLPAASTEQAQTPVTEGHPTEMGMAVDRIRTDVPDSEKVETAWMYNRLVFDGDSFQELADKMERWFDVRIFVRDPSLNHYHFGGAFFNESIEEALKDLQLTAEFTYTINGNEIELYAKR